MPVAPITRADLLQVYGICDRANEQMDFGSMGYPYSHEAMAKNWPGLLDDPKHVCLCHKTGDRVDGIFLARLQDNSYFMQNYLVSYEIALHADPALPAASRGRITLELRREAERRMEHLGVRSFFASTHPQQVGGMDRNMEKNGYREIGRYRVKEFPHGILRP